MGCINLARRDNNTSDWDGYANKGMLSITKNADGTYYYVIELNDSEYYSRRFYTYQLVVLWTNYLFSK
jgi:hypothetical protein